MGLRPATKPLLQIIHVIFKNTNVNTCRTYVGLNERERDLGEDERRYLQHATDINCRISAGIVFAKAPPAMWWWSQSPRSASPTC